MPDDIDWIEQSGKTRNEFGKNRGWKSRTSSTDDKWNIMGMAGEWASSLVLNLGIGQITGEVDELNSGDLKGMIEVRTSGGSSPWQWDLGGFKSVLEKKTG